MLAMKCDRCGKPFSHLHAVHVVVDRDYARLALDEGQCTDCLDAFLGSLKPKASDAATSAATG